MIRKIKREQILYATDDELDAHEELYIREVSGQKNLAVVEVAKMINRPPTRSKFIIVRVDQV